MRVKKFLKRIVLTLAVIYLFVCLAVFAFQEKLLFIPEKLPNDFQFHFDHSFAEDNLPCTSGDTINEIIFRADSSKGLVIYFHGNAGSLRTWGNVAPDFLKNNYDVVMMDYSGYGKSKGKISEENLFSDAQDLYNEMKKNYDETKIIICGRSLGTGIAAHLASENNPQKLILEAPYYSMKDLAHHLYPFLPAFILRYPLRTDLYFEKIKCPVSIIHGTDDEIIYYESSLKLKKLFKPGDELITIKGGHHNDLKTFEEYCKHRPN